jgi:hypothetical protein
LRIENRVLPSGPSIVDEVANAALFYGLMLELEQSVGDPALRVSFADAKCNFMTAARDGLDATFAWLDGRRVAAQDLLLDELLPAARAGLERVGAPDSDLDRYFGVLAQRIAGRTTGANYALEALGVHQKLARHESALRRLALDLLRGQRSGLPVAEWPTPIS